MYFFKSNLVLLDTEMFDEDQAQPWNVGDHEQGDDHDDDEGDAGPVESHNGFIEPEAGDEEI